jgi:hypothetical protein
MPVVQIALALAQFAPQLMRFFGAGEPSVAVAQQVVGIAQNITGAPTPEAALEQMRANAQFQKDFALATLNADTALEQAFLADRQNSRAHDIEVRKLNAGKNTRADLMIVGATAGLIACLVTLVFFQGQIPGEVVGIVATIAGIFGACLRDAFQFEFGSSRGSKDKDDVIASFTRLGPPAP